MATTDSHTPTPSTPPTPAPSSTPPNPQLPHIGILSQVQPSFWAADDYARFSATAIKVAGWSYAGDRMMLAMRQPEGKNLSPTARLVAAAYAWRGWISWPSQLSVAKMLNVWPSTVNAAVKELVAAGMMVVLNRHSGKGNRQTDKQYGFVGNALLVDTLADPAIITRITGETPTPAPNFPDSGIVNPGNFPDSGIVNPGNFPDSGIVNPGNFPDSGIVNPGDENPEHPPEKPPENHFPDSRFPNQTKDRDDDDDIDPVNHHHQDSGYGTRAKKTEKISVFPPPEFADFPPPPAGYDPDDFYAALTIAKTDYADMDPQDVDAALKEMANRNKAKPRDRVASLKAWLPGIIGKHYRARKNSMQAKDKHRAEYERQRKEDESRPWQERHPMYWPDEWRIWDNLYRQALREGKPPPQPPPDPAPKLLKHQVAEIRRKYAAGEY